MRRLIAISMLLVAVSVSAGCTAKSNSASSSGSGGSGSSGSAAANSSAGVCASLRTVVTSDIGPVGSALGTMVGATTGKSSAAQKTAAASATAALKKFGSDLTAAAAAGNDPAVLTAVATAQQNISELVSDPSFLSDVKTMDDISAATTKLQTATEPITKACDGS